MAEAHLDEAQLLDLLHGLAGEAAARAMLDHARRCADCERRLRAHAAEIETLRARPIPAVATRVGVRRARWRIPLGVAAVAAAILALLWSQRAQNAAVEGFWIPAGRTLLQQRGAEDDAAYRALEQGIRAYDARDLSQAIPLLEQAQSAPERDTLRRIYLASAYLQERRVATALLTLEGLDPRTLPQPWQDEARWILYLALSEQERPEALDLLDSLATRPGPIGDRARSLQMPR